MELDAARTFLAIVESGSFSGAAQQLHLTQSTVSARIKALETRLGRKLFERKKGGARLTHAGQRFERHATRLLHNWEQATREVTLPSGFARLLTIGARPEIWTELLLDWLAELGRVSQDTAVRIEFGSTDQIVARLIEGEIDAALLLAPVHAPNLLVEPLVVLDFILAGTDPPRETSSLLPPDYVHVDWGSDFQHAFSTHFGAAPGSRVTFSSGLFGLDYVLREGGSGYFPVPAIRQAVRSGHLKIVDGAPKIEIQSYLAVAADLDDVSRDIVLRGLKQTASGTRGVSEP